MSNVDVARNGRYNDSVKIYDSGSSCLSLGTKLDICSYHISMLQETKRGPYDNVVGWYLCY